MTVLFAFLHHLAAFTLVAALSVEFVLIRQELTLGNARRILAADTVFGASAGVLLGVGLARVFFFEKGAAYYFSSHAFLGKFCLFVIVGLLSIVPTLEFLSWRRLVKQGRATVTLDKKIRLLRTIIHIELATIVFILLFAVIMARSGWV